MRFKVKQSLIELVQGDIVDQDVDAIVNAANSSLLGGGGVDGSIHYAAGPELLAECRTLGGCPTGEACITKGYRLKARHVIHTVGPVYRTIGRINWDGDSAVDTRPEAELLAGAYRSSLQLASQHGIKTIAFPSISTGAYGYPLDQAAPIALRTVVKYLNDHPDIELVRFVLWDGTTRVAYERAATALLSERTG
jgi:O-acetyl-ADP-ribose deacetylase